MHQIRFSLLRVVKLPLMRFIVAVFVVLAIILGVLTYQNRFGVEEKVNSSGSRSAEKKSIKPSGKYQPQKILFVPYWTITSTNNIEDFDTLAYFGIAVDRSGINEDESGYKNINKFLDASEDKNNYLVVRMLDSEIINDVLENSSARKNVITQSIDVARQHKFKGIILDLEFSAIPFESVIKRVANFYKEFYAEARKNNLEFSSLLYGDTYFRGRPYEVSEIGKNSDRVYIMAYDFHKSRGNPGPNFPLKNKDKYGYDFKTMVSDFKLDVPAEKLATVFGMFGYDWPIDNEGRSKSPGVPKTTYQIEAFLEKCTNESSCVVDKDLETQIKYENEREKHEMWFEDKNSVNEKIKYLNSQGLTSVGYWANSFWNSKL